MQGNLIHVLMIYTVGYNLDIRRTECYGQGSNSVYVEYVMLLTLSENAESEFDNKQEDTASRSES